VEGENYERAWARNRPLPPVDRLSTQLMQRVKSRFHTYNPDTWRRAFKTCIYHIITMPPECIRNRHILWM